MTIKESDVFDGFIEDTKKKLIVPKALSSGVHSTIHPLNNYILNKDATAGVAIKTDGVHLERDEYTGILKFAPYGSGLDDLLNRAVVGGWVANVGYAGVIDPIISALVTKIIMKAGAITMIITGRKLARRRAKELLNRADNSRLGWDDFARNVVAGLLIDNRGVAISRLPIYSKPFSMWAEAGMNPIPIEGLEKERTKNEKGEDIPVYYYMDATNRALRKSETLETVDVLDIRPTGNPDWPYWLCKRIHKTGAKVWVLISGQIGLQIIVGSMPKTSIYPGMGQSGMYRYNSIMVKDIIYQDSVFESIMLQPPDIVWGVGLDHPDQLFNAMTTNQKDMEEAGVRYRRGKILGGSEAENAKIVKVEWSQRPEGFTEAGWKEYREDLGAQCIHSSITEVGRIQVGRGSATQATLNVESEAMFSFFGMKFEQIATWATTDVAVKAVLKSSRSTMTHNQTVKTLMEGIESAQRAGTAGMVAEGESNVFSPEEIRAMYDQSGVNTPTDSGASDTEMLAILHANRIKQRVYRRLQVPTEHLEGGTLVVLANYDLAVVEEDTGSGNVWLSTKADDIVLLYRKSRLRLYRSLDSGR